LQRSLIDWRSFPMLTSHHFNRNPVVVLGVDAENLVQQ
jgi:hypothetical protein